MRRRTAPPAEVNHYEALHEGAHREVVVHRRHAAALVVARAVQKVDCQALNLEHKLPPRLLGNLFAENPTLAETERKIRAAQRRGSRFLQASLGELQPLAGMFGYAQVRSTGRFSRNCLIETVRVGELDSTELGIPSGLHPNAVTKVADSKNNALREGATLALLHSSVQGLTGSVTIEALPSQTGLLADFGFEEAGTQDRPPVRFGSETIPVTEMTRTIRGLEPVLAEAVGFAAPFPVGQITPNA